MGITLFAMRDYVEGGDQMNKTLKKLTILVVVSLAVIGGIWGGLFATASAENHDEAALGTGHFIITIRPPGGAPITINGRTTVVLEKVDGKWLRVHTHGSALP